MRKLLFLLLSTSFILSEKIAVIGSGYVGLVTAACLSTTDNKISCVDNNVEKIKSLKQNRIPIFEPGLDTLIIESRKKNRIAFTTNLKKAISKSRIIIVAVGTPMNDFGDADLSFLDHVFNEIALYLEGNKIVVIKSTVPVGTAQQIRERIYREFGKLEGRDYTLISCPEFLREGSAIQDFIKADRIVIGGTQTETLQYFSTIIAKVSPKAEIVITDNNTAELIKYASNAFLAMKIGFINEVANYCDQASANIKDVAWGMGLDMRINPYFLNPGPGFGGSCFPKDCAALCRFSKKIGASISLAEATLKANEVQKLIPFKKLQSLMDGTLVGKKIAILGLAFKANTDDIRYSPSIVVIDRLLKASCQVHAYDPHAMENMKELYPNIIYHASAYQALEGMDAAIIMTEWPEFFELDLEKIGSLMREKIMIDARNIFSCEKLNKYKFKWSNIGQSSLKRQS